MCRGRDGSLLSGIAVEGRCYSAICIPVDHNMDDNECCVRRANYQSADGVCAAISQVDRNEEGIDVNCVELLAPKGRAEHENKGVSDCRICRAGM